MAKSIRPSAPRLRRHWQNSNTASNPHVYREFQKFKTTQKEDTMTQAIASQRSSEQADAIRPFPNVNVPEAELTELRRRINAGLARRAGAPCEAP